MGGEFADDDVVTRRGDLDALAVVQARGLGDVGGKADSGIFPQRPMTARTMDRPSSRIFLAYPRRDVQSAERAKSKATLNGVASV